MQTPDQKMGDQSRGPKLSKQERIARERELLLGQLAAGQISTIRAAVAFVLSHYPEARDSDKALAWKYWRMFQGNVMRDSDELTLDMLMKLENFNSLTRARQKIQNEFGLFQASETVRAVRQERQLDFQEALVADQPGAPLVEVFCDESGKTGNFVLVGSLWTYDTYRASQMARDLVKLKTDRQIRGELHFSELDRKNLDNAKAFFTEAVAHSDILSFKAVAVRRQGLTRSIQETVMELHYQLIMLGINHEFRTGRLTPPRVLQVWKDKEDGLDTLHLTKLGQNLHKGLADHMADKATLQILEAVDSKSNFLIQLTDLFTGSVNRALNRTGEKPNQKDDFATFALRLLGLEISTDGTISSAKQDIATVIVLGG